MCALTIPTLLIETKDASKDDRKLERKEGRSAVRAGKKPDSLTQGGEYTVLYVPANAVHTVPRARLRPIFTWDYEGHKFAAIKSSARR